MWQHNNNDNYIISIIGIVISIIVNDSVGLTASPRNDRNLVNSQSTFDDSRIHILHCKKKGFWE